jgi:hypothetical protein
MSTQLTGFIHNSLTLTQHTDHPCQRTRNGFVHKEPDRAFRLNPTQADQWIAGDPKGCAMVVGSGIPGIKIQEATPLVLGQPNYVEAVWEENGRLFKGIVVGTDHTSTIPLQIISVNDADKMRDLVTMIGSGVELLIVGITSSVRRVAREPQKTYGPMTRGQVKHRGERDADTQFAEIAKGTRTELDPTVPDDIAALPDDAGAEYRKRFESQVATLRRQQQSIPPQRRSNTRALKGRRPLA